MMKLNALREISFILILNFIRAEFYTALDEVGYLLETRKRVIDDVSFYINAESKTLPILKRYLDLFKIEYEMASKGISNYLENPLNAFILIKRLVTDLKYVKHLIKTGEENINNVTIKHEKAKYPTPEDLIGAVKGLMSLEEVYKLDIKEIANGKLNGFVYSSPLTAGDCYEFARILFNELDPESAVTLMEEALRKYYEEKFPYLFTDIEIMEYISYGNYMLGNPKIALYWTKKILNIEPNHSRARNSLIRIQKEIYERETRPKNNFESEETFEQETENDIETQMDDEKNDPNSPESYQAICRGDFGVPAQISSRLTCRYLTENHPFLKIAPFKIEIVYINPDIIIFYDVLSDTEINSMKELAKPRLRRAVDQDLITGEKVPSEDRISKSATIIEKYFNIFAPISRRAMYMTGLSMEKSREIQITNYGIGGYYSPHYDFVHVNNNTYIKGGRRIATLLFYLSSVSSGGATIFPYFGVSVPPIKGAALFWYNLYSSGEANHAMLHADCPVLRGSKWVATKWILQGGQEFIKPCDLEYQPEGINDKTLSPMIKETRERRSLEKYKKVSLAEDKSLSQQNQEDIEVDDE